MQTNSSSIANHKSQIPTTAYIALGSNLGDREAAIRDALKRLDLLPGIRMVRASSLLDNPAVGGPAGSPPYLNAVAEISTQLSATDLLAALLRIESDMGRVRRARWEPRIIDLDLLLYGDEIINTAALIVPHPLMHERRFVLAPLAEIAAQAIHPRLRKSIRELLADLDKRSAEPLEPLMP